MPDAADLTPEQRRVVQTYRDIEAILAKLCFGDAMTALGMAANRAVQSLPPHQRIAVAKAWGETFVRNVYAAIEINDA